MIEQKLYHSNVNSYQFKKKVILQRTSDMEYILKNYFILTANESSRLD